MRLHRQGGRGNVRIGLLAMLLRDHSVRFAVAIQMLPNLPRFRSAAADLPNTVVRMASRRDLNQAYRKVEGIMIRGPVGVRRMDALQLGRRMFRHADPAAMRAALEAVSIDQLVHRMASGCAR